MKKLSAIVLLISISTTLYCQTFERIYENKYYFGCESRDNSYLLVGEQPVDDTLDNISVLRVSAVNGNKISEYIYTLPGYDFLPNLILETSDGGAYICAVLRYTNFLGDPVVIRIDSCGNPIWMRNIKSIFCPDLGLTNMNLVNYAVLDGNDGLTFVIGLECTSLYCFNMNLAGNFNWVSDAFGEDSWMMSGTSFRRLASGNYAITGWQNTWWSDTVTYANDYKINAYIKLIDSIGNFISEEEYFMHPDGSYLNDVTDAWGSDQYMTVGLSGFDDLSILALSEDLDSNFSENIISVDDYLVSPLDIYQGPKGLYYIAGHAYDIDTFSNLGIGVQLIDGLGNVIAQNIAGYELVSGYRNCFVTYDQKLVFVSNFIDTTAEADYDYDTYLMRFDQDLTYSYVTDTVTPESAALEGCNYDSTTMYFDLTPIMEECYAYALYDSALIVHAQADFVAEENAYEINVYPNPMNRNATMSWSDNDPVIGIQIFSLNGDLIRSVVVDQTVQHWIFNRENLAVGLYAYVVSRSNGKQTTGFISIQ